MTSNGNVYILIAVDYFTKFCVCINKTVSENLQIAHDRQKKSYDKFVKNSVTFNPGDLVLVINSRSQPGESDSFKNRLIGPYKVLQAFNEILCLKDGKMHIVHYNRLIKYRARDSELFSSRANSIVDEDKNVRPRHYSPNLINKNFDWDLSEYMVNWYAGNRVAPEPLLNFMGDFNFELNDLPNNDSNLVLSLECVVCDREFTGISGLKRHQTRKHRVSNDEQVVEDGIVSNQVQIGEDVIPLALVVRELESISVESETQSLVSDVPRHVCHICGRVCKSGQGLLSHIRKAKNHT
ncbi:hypothetical protein BpHYR1_001507 [Brachionus plicatilis]|uniref:C2H2-type domain-containing protein n=1 Tax=Brachionus plicatilis TaxID=10195 RepID=A0A3M7PD89_BRAPC|nr:hypothetical protein BpHYR1_001507 [Brachionus plicatilis]